MVKKRLIPVLVLRDGTVVRSVNFTHTNVIHWKPSTAVDFFNKWAVDEIVLLDVSRDTAQRGRFYEVVDGLSRKCFVPLTVGGWVTTINEMRTLLRLGADKVAINTQALRRPEFITECAEVFGSQCIVVAIDVRRAADGAPEVWIDRGRERTAWRAPGWAREAERRGAGEILLTSIDREGNGQGYDIELVRSVVDAVGIPVIAFGGAFEWRHLVEGIVVGGAEAVAAANVFHFTEHSTKKAKEFMRAAGIDVRCGRSMRYCARCLYPENARPTIIFDEHGICSGCRHHEARHRIDWAAREARLGELLTEFRDRSRAAGNIYDCIIPVSGGKDSHFQVHLIKEVYGLNPLCVTFNHCFNTALGIRNLNNLVEKFGIDLLRFTASPGSVRKIARYMVKKVGDLTWHYHAGIMTVPFQVAVRYKIPLIIWPEHYGELTGVFTLDDMVEFTKWVRQEHDMRGIEPDDIVNDPASGITKRDLFPYYYPSDEEIEEVGVRGIFLTNYIYWDAKAQAELVIEKYGFKPLSWKRDRTFSLYAKTDDHANEVHDYMKYLKFGYGRATDDASTEIRYGRMTREEGIEMVRQYDHVRPRSLDVYLEFLQMTEAEFEAAIEPMRHPAIWERQRDGRWVAKDSVVNHINDPGVEAAQVLQVEDRTFSPRNHHLYYNQKFPPQQAQLAAQAGWVRPNEIHWSENNFIIL